ncbi:MAG TPA: DUF5117 domain-containing protein, partial [Gemmatimonadaceae bacterium]
MRSSRYSAAVAIIVAATLASCRSTQAPAPAAAVRPAAGQPGAGAPAGGQAAGGAAQDTARPPAGGAAVDPQPRPYNRVITAQARSRDGMFKTHRLGSRVYFEIPRSQLNRDMLLVTRVSRTPVNAGYGGQQIGPRRVVRWERRDNRVYLRNVSFETVADSTSPIFQAVRNSNTDVIIAGFNVDAYGPDSAAVIDVTRMYVAPPPEMGPGNQFRGVPDAQRSFVERVLSFPQNVDVEATLTIPPPPNAPAAAQGNPFAPAATGTATIGMYWSMVRLPDKPMMPRLADKRIGFFSLQNLDYGRPEQRAQRRQYIVRWRLEKKDPNAAKSEPIKPITYYVDPATPKWLVPWVKKGIEDWQPAFEEAGFIRGIVAKD